MKKILFLLFIITGSFLFGQGGQAEYKIELTNLSYSVNAGVKNSTSSHVTITVFYDDNSSEDLYNRGIAQNGDNENNWLLNPPVKSTKLPVKIRTEGFVNFRTGTDAGFDRTEIINICNQNIYDIDSNSPRMSHITFKLKTTPIHSLLSLTNSGNANTLLPSDEKVNFYAREGFAADLYNYQYSLDNVNWINIDPSFSTLNKLSVSGKDILGANYAQYVGQNIYFRVASCLENGVYQAVSTPLVLTLLQSSPSILSATSTDNLCSYGETGTATINFSRKLLTGETLKISLVNTVTGAAVINKDVTADLQNNTALTLQNLPPATYKLDILGTYNGNATFTDSPNHTFSFVINKPAPVTFELASKTDVYCFQGSDGNIALNAGGGQNQYQYQVSKDGQSFLDWTNFSNGTNTLIQNLSAGVYKIKVRDSNLCIARDAGVDKEITVTITEPATPIALSETQISQPTGNGLSDGFISVRVTGGTPKADNSYDFEWRRDTQNGAVIATGIVTDAVNNPFTIKLSGIPAGKYYLTVKDKNYNAATSQLGNCGIISQEFIVLQPEPVIATIEVQQQISCNKANDFAYVTDANNNGIPDESEDGSLKAIVTGGVGTYSYQWQILVNGVYQNLVGETQAILAGQSAGNYRVLVKDANQNAGEAVYTFSFPAQLKISLSANTIACSSQNSGMVSVTATGGTGNFSYNWNTSDTTPTVSGLPAGNYFVLVSDAKNCKVKGNIEVIQPDAMVITDVSVQNPICSASNTGEIKINLTGGKAPYSIVWSNGYTGTDNLSLKAGTYGVTVTDANGCSVFKEYNLVDPAPFTVELGNDVTLCLGDTQTYDVNISDPAAKYEWKNQKNEVISTSSKITLSAAGTYTVKIINSKGCIAIDNVTIKNSSDVLNPQFLITTLAYKESSVIIVNTSPTKPQSVEWIIPNNANIIVIGKTDDYLELKFLKTGSYDIGLKGKQGECVKTFSKNIIVEENINGVNLNPTNATNIKEFTIVPNPNNGVYKVIVKLNKENTINLRILDMISHEAFPLVSKPKNISFEVPFDTTLPGGTYIVILETGGEVLVKRMIVK